MQFVRARQKNQREPVEIATGIVRPEGRGASAQVGKRG